MTELPSLVMNVLPLYLIMISKLMESVKIVSQDVQFVLMVQLYAVTIVILGISIMLIHVQHVMTVVEHAQLLDVEVEYVQIVPLIIMLMQILIVQLVMPHVMNVLLQEMVPVLPVLACIG